MNIKSLLIAGVAAMTLAGCASNYNFFPDKKHNIGFEELSVKDQSIKMNGTLSSVEIKSLEKEIGPWTSPRMKITFTNNSEDRLMVVKPSNIRIGFSNFWFDIVEYKISDDRPEEYQFTNNENFKYEHEVLPGESITLDATFKTPKSQEYYSNDLVLIEAYTNLDIFNISYKIKKTRR